MGTHSLKRVTPRRDKSEFGCVYIYVYIYKYTNTKTYDLRSITRGRVCESRRLTGPADVIVVFLYGEKINRGSLCFSCEHHLREPEGVFGMKHERVKLETRTV